MYTYEVSGNPPMCSIKKDGTVIDYSGPWESVEAAESWAQLFVDQCNSGYDPFSSI